MTSLSTEKKQEKRNKQRGLLRMKKNMRWKNTRQFEILLFLKKEDVNKKIHFSFVHNAHSLEVHYCSKKFTQYSTEYHYYIINRIKINNRYNIYCPLLKKKNHNQHHHKIRINVYALTYNNYVQR